MKGCQLTRTLQTRGCGGPNCKAGFQSARLRWGSFGLQSPLYGFWIIGNNPEIGPSSLVRLTASLLPISQSAQWNAKARGKFFLRQVQGTTQSFDARYTTSVLSLLLCHRTGIRITHSSSMDLLVCHKPHRHIIIRKWHLSAIIQYFDKCAIRSPSGDSSRLAHLFLPFWLILTGYVPHVQY